MGGREVSEQHTQEPWFDSDPSDDPVYEPRIFDREGMQIAHVYEWADFSIPHHERIAIQAANARRIVACVNACAGIQTEDLEAVPSFETAGVTTVRAVKKQRDELLAALEALRSACFDRRIANDEFERLGDLYFREFGRLRPGKDDPFRDSGERENVRQYEAWSRSRTEAAIDLADAAIARAQGEAK